MRIRASHVVVAGIAVVSAFVLFAVVRLNSADSAIDVGDEGFYDSSVASLPPAGGEAGLLPGDGDRPEALPRISVPTDHFHTGVVSNKEPTSHDFLITNEGDRELVIERVDTTCACTRGYFGDTFDPKAPAPLAVIAPHTSVPMKIRIDPFLIPQFETTKTLTIVSNDSRKPLVTVDVTSQVDPEFAVEPMQLEFGKVTRGKAESRTMIIRQVNDDPFEVTGVEPYGNAVMPANPGISAASGGGTIPTFTLRLIKRPEDQWREAGKPEWALDVALSPELPEGPFRGYFYVMTTCKRVPRIPCSLTADLESFFRVVPNVITNRAGIQRGEPAAGSTTIISEVPFVLESIAIDNKWFEVKTAPGDEPNSLRLDVIASPEIPLGPTSGIINFVIKAEDGRSYSQNVTVVLNVRE